MTKLTRIQELEDMGVEELAGLAFELESQVEDLHEEAAVAAAGKPVERYADWYKRMHPRGPGSDPDLRVGREQVKIVA